MTKKTVEPLYMLPDDKDGPMCMAYAHGLDALPLMAFHSLPPGAPLPSGWQFNMPIEPNDIEEMARGACHLMLKTRDKQPVTNSRSLFRKYYISSYVDGYDFALYGMLHDMLLPLFYGIPTDRRYDLAFRFAWEYIKKEPAPDSDLLMISSLDQLKALHRRFLADPPLV